MMIENISEIRNYIKKNYPQLKNIKEIELLPSNNINSENFLFFSNKNAYVLRNFMDRSNPKKIEKICNILISCKKTGAFVPEPIKNRKNRYVDKSYNRYVTKYYFGNPFSGTTREISNVGSSLAILHKSLSQNKISYNYKARYSMYKILNLKELKKINKIISHKKHKTLFDLIIEKHYQKFIKIYNLLRSSPDNHNNHRQLIHYDLHPGNIIFSKNKVATIIDFNTMRKDLTIYDITYASFRLAINSTKNPRLLKDLIKIFVKSYLKNNEIKIEHLLNFDYFLLKILYTYVSYLLRLRYFHDDDKWSHDIEKFVQFLDRAYKERITIRKTMRSINRSVTIP